jgi:hypothetical protein
MWRSCVQRDNGTFDLALRKHFDECAGIKVRRNVFFGQKRDSKAGKRSFPKR